MSNYIKVLVLFFTLTTSLQAQDLGDMFVAEEFDYHTGIDSIVSTTYMLNEYADDEPDLKFSYDGQDMMLHSYESSSLVYIDKHSSVTKTETKLNGLTRILTLKFDERGNTVYKKSQNLISELKDEELFSSYDEQNRLVSQIRKGYNTLEFEGGNTTIYTDTTLIRKYNENNLIEAATFSMHAGMAMNIETQYVGDTIRYEAEMIMTGFMKEQMEQMEKERGPMPGKKEMRRHIMDIVKNSETGNFEATEVERRGMSSKQIIDPSGKLLEKITYARGEVTSHEKFNYDGEEMVGVETLVGEAPKVVYNDKGQKISEETMRGLKKFEYDDKGNIVKEIAINPYSMEFEEVKVFTIYYGK